MISNEGILYIEPSMRVSRTPTIDKLTRRMTAALRQGTPGRRTRGFHTCRCGQRSTNVDYTLPDGQTTNALSVHYLAWHRNEVPQNQLDKVRALDYGMADPTPEELRSPHVRPSGSKPPRVTR